MSESSTDPGQLYLKYLSLTLKDLAPGFSVRTGRMTVTEGSVDFTISRHWSVNGYVGVMKGGEVVQRTFTGDRLVFAYAENVLQFQKAGR